METKTYRSDSTRFFHHLDPILRNDFSCRSESTEKPILAVTDPTDKRKQIFSECVHIAGVVHANVRQKLLNCYPLRVFTGDQ
jgi:hypothetical protein